MVNDRVCLGKAREITVLMQKRGVFVKTPPEAQSALAKGCDPHSLKLEIAFSLNTFHSHISFLVCLGHPC